MDKPSKQKPNPADPAAQEATKLTTADLESAEVAHSRLQRAFETSVKVAEEAQRRVAAAQQAATQARNRVEMIEAALKTDALALDEQQTDAKGEQADT